MYALTERLRSAGCVFAEDEARLLSAAAASAEDLAALVERRTAGHPLEHVLGWAEFCGDRVRLAPGVFVPRRRTELLVREAAASAPPGACVLDLCCGSGAIGLALGRLRPDVAVHAVDIDPVAVACARQNLSEVAGSVHHGDLYSALPAGLRGTVDVIVVNAPYVPTAAIPLLPAEARLREPRIAVDGGADGLDVARRVISQAPEWLTAGGHLLIESSAGQAAAVMASMRSAELTPRAVTAAGSEGTVVLGTRDM